MKIKKYLSLLLVAVTFMGIFAHNSNALPQYLEYWYAKVYDEEHNTFIDNANVIRYFSSSPTMYKENLSGFSNTSFNSYFTHGRDQWYNAGLTSNYSLLEGNANFKVYGGNYIDLIDVISNFKSSDIARTSPTNGYGTSIACMATGGYKTAYELSNVIIAVKYSANITDTMYKNIFLHEMGHGFGWDNHSDNSSDVMYPRSSNITSLTSRDINHIKQMY